MTEILPSLVAVLGLTGLASLAARHLRVPSPVLLAVAGIAWSLVPLLPQLEIDPHIVLSVFLPPLLYEQAWKSSWQDFRRWLRPILQLGIALVAFTTLCVGVAAHWLMPQLPWAVCFLLGALLSPTDTVAVFAVLSSLRVPRRLTAILEGESLINDATALLGVQLAATVVLTGVFEAGAIATRFVQITGIGLASGVAVGFFAAWLNSVLRRTPQLFVFSLAVPYLAFAGAETLGASGILAVVVAGFVASWRLHVIAPESRADLYVAWDMLAFLLNSLMFLFVGVELPRRLAGYLEGGGHVLSIALGLAALAILVRFVWVWPSAYLSLWLFPRLREREGGYPDPRGVVLAGWCGVRGAVALAAAISLPRVLPDGSLFPGRDEVVVTVLVTILVTLIGQASTLVPLVRWLDLPSDPTKELEVRRSRETMLAAGIARLDELCTERSCPIDVYRYRDSMADQLAGLRAIDESERKQAATRLAVSREVRRAVWEAQTAELLRQRDAGEINDGTHQELQLQLDRDHSDMRLA